MAGGKSRKQIHRGLNLAKAASDSQGRSQARHLAQMRRWRLRAVTTDTAHPMQQRYPAVLAAELQIRGEEFWRHLACHPKS
jgi:hypothetical protein